jgi:hypothetical protein
MESAGRTRIFRSVKDVLEKVGVFTANIPETKLRKFGSLRGSEKRKSGSHGRKMGRGESLS